MTPSNPCLRIFISFADDDVEHLRRLLKHMAPLVAKQEFSVWSRQSLLGGEDKNLEAQERDRADVLVALLSSDYLASESKKEKRDVELAEERGCRVVPVLLRPCSYQEDKLLHRYTPLPQTGAGMAFPIVASTQAAHDDTLNATTEQLTESVRQLRNAILLQWGVPWPADMAAPEARTGPRSTGDGFRDGQPSRRQPPPRQPPSGPLSSGQPHSGASPLGQPPLGPAPRTARSLLPWVVASAAVAVAAIAVVLGVIFPAARGDSGAPAGSSSASGSPAVPSSGRTPSLMDAPPLTAPLPIVPAPVSPGAGEVRRCCGGVDCKPPERDVTGTYCEKLPNQCRDCFKANRSYVGGSCSDHLASQRSFLLRLAFHSLGAERKSKGAPPAGPEPATTVKVPAGDVAQKAKPAPAAEADQVCIRLAGTLDWTCTDTHPRANTVAPRLPVQVGDLLHSGRGLDIELRRGGSAIRSRLAAKTDSLSAAMLCIGLNFTVETGYATFYLDDP